MCTKNIDKFAWGGKFPYQVRFTKWSGQTAKFGKKQMMELIGSQKITKLTEEQQQAVFKMFLPYVEQDASAAAHDWSAAAQSHDALFLDDVVSGVVGVGGDGDDLHQAPTGSRLASWRERTPSILDDYGGLSGDVGGLTGDVIGGKPLGLFGGTGERALANRERKEDVVSVMIYQTWTWCAIKRMEGSANQRYAQTPDR